MKCLVQVLILMSFVFAVGCSKEKVTPENADVDGAWEFVSFVQDGKTVVIPQTEGVMQMVFTSTSVRILLKDRKSGTRTDQITVVRKGRTFTVKDTGRIAFEIVKITSNTLQIAGFSYSGRVEALVNLKRVPVSQLISLPSAPPAPRQVEPPAPAPAVAPSPAAGPPAAKDFVFTPVDVDGVEAVEGERYCVGARNWQYANAAVCHKFDLVNSDSKFLFLQFVYDDPQPKVNPWKDVEGLDKVFTIASYDRHGNPLKKYRRQKSTSPHSGALGFGEAKKPGGSTIDIQGDYSGAAVWALGTNNVFPVYVDKDYGFSSRYICHLVRAGDPKSCYAATRSQFLRFRNLKLQNTSEDAQALIPRPRKISFTDRVVWDATSASECYSKDDCMMSVDRAANFCQLKGLRLPTVREWAGYAKSRGAQGFAELSASEDMSSSELALYKKVDRGLYSSAGYTIEDEEKSGFQRKYWAADGHKFNVMDGGFEEVPSSNYKGLASVRCAKDVGK